MRRFHSTTQGSPYSDLCNRFTLDTAGVNTLNKLHIHVHTNAARPSEPGCGKFPKVGGGFHAWRPFLRLRICLRASVLGRREMEVLFIRSRLPEPGKTGAAVQDGTEAPLVCPEC